MAMAIIVGPSEPEIFPFLLGKSWVLATFGRMKPRLIPSLITQLQQDSCDFLPNSYLPTVCCVFFPSPFLVAFSHFTQDLKIFFQAHFSPVMSEISSWAQLPAGAHPCLWLTASLKICFDPPTSMGFPETQKHLKMIGETQPIWKWLVTGRSSFYHLVI